MSMTATHRPDSRQPDRKHRGVPRIRPCSDRQRGRDPRGGRRTRRGPRLPGGRASRNRPGAHPSGRPTTARCGRRCRTDRAAGAPAACPADRTRSGREPPGPPAKQPLQDRPAHTERQRRAQAGQLQPPPRRPEGDHDGPADVGPGDPHPDQVIAERVAERGAGHPVAGPGDPAEHHAGVVAVDAVDHERRARLGLGDLVHDRPRRGPDDATGGGHGLVPLPGHDLLGTSRHVPAGRRVVQAPGVARDHERADRVQVDPAQARLGLHLEQGGEGLAARVAVVADAEPVVVLAEAHGGVAVVHRLAGEVPQAAGHQRVRHLGVLARGGADGIRSRRRRPRSRPARRGTPRAGPGRCVARRPSCPGR